MKLQRWHYSGAILLSLHLLIQAGCTGERNAESAQTSPEIVAPSTHSDLKAFLAARNYDWATVTAGVPPFILETLPADLHRAPTISEKKELFFLSLLPMVLLVNEEISSQRQLLEKLLADRRAGKTVAAEARQWAVDLAAEYNLAGDPLENSHLEALLLRRLDIVPPSLALAQAATESGFGTSHFALTRKNLFGEFAYAEGGEGGRKYRLRTFPTLYDSVQAYVRNLNTHAAYTGFRVRRAELRGQGEPLAGSELAKELTAYSERGDAYIRDIQQIMRQNRLSLLASVNLRTGQLEPNRSAGAAVSAPP